MLFQQHIESITPSPFPDELLWTLSSQAIFSSFSVYLAQMTGWSEQDWLGKPLQNFIHPNDLPLIKDRYDDVLRGQTVRFEKIRCLGRGGESLFWELAGK